MKVNELWTGHVLDVPENPYEFLHIMTVEGTKIPDIQSLKYILLTSEQRLHSVVEAQHNALAAVANDTMLAHRLVSLVAQVVVALRCRQASHVFSKGSHGAVDRHVVVVKHDEQVILVNRGIVDSLKCQPAAN